MWIGLNPSTADEGQLDPTLRRIKAFSRSMGYGAFVMTNLFAFRATDPRVMKAHATPIGQENDKWLVTTALDCAFVMAAWGVHGAHLNRGPAVADLLPRQLHCLGRTKDGAPKHPLYVAAATTFIPYQ